MPLKEARERERERGSSIKVLESFVYFLACNLFPTNSCTSLLLSLSSFERGTGRAGFTPHCESVRWIFRSILRDITHFAPKVESQNQNLCQASSGWLAAGVLLLVNQNQNHSISCRSDFTDRIIRKYVEVSPQNIVVKIREKRQRQRQRELEGEGERQTGRERERERERETAPLVLRERERRRDGEPEEHEEHENA